MEIRRSNLRKPPAVLLILLILVFSSEAYALQKQNASPEYKLNTQFLKSFANDFGRVVIAPKGWDGKDLIKLSALIASGTLIFVFDQDIHQWMQERRSPATDDISSVSEALGHGIFLGSTITALYVTGEIIDNIKLRKIALLSLETWLISGGIVGGMKFLIGRARPHKQETSTTFHPFSFRSRYRSFPSGHTASAFAVATMIADHSEEFIVDLIAYSLASLAGVSRIHDGAHWASDVFFGAVMGYFISKKIAAWHRQEGKKNLQVDLQFVPHRQSFTISFTF